MKNIGILKPDGSFIECERYEHLELERELVETLDEKFSYLSSLDCELYLQKLGYVIVRASDVYGFIGHLDDNHKIIHLTDKQKKWLEDHYSEFPSDKQRSVDDIIDHSERR